VRWGSNGMFRIIIGLFLTGLLFGAGPCLASCGPVLISYIAATKKNIYGGLFAYSLFSFARISVYLFLSLAIFYFGQFTTERLLHAFSGYIFITAGVFICVMGLLLVLDKKIDTWPFRVLNKYVLEKEKKNSAVLGIVFGLLPCAPLFVLLSYIGLFSKTWLESLIYALAFGAGTFLSPLLFLAIFTGLMPVWLKDRKEIYYRILIRLCGLFIVFLGIQLIKRGM